MAATQAIASATMELIFFLIEGKIRVSHFPLMVDEAEGLAQLVFLNQAVNERDRAYAFHEADATRASKTTSVPSRWDRKLLLLPINGRLHLKG